MASVNITIDGRKIVAQAGQTVYEAATASTRPRRRRESTYRTFVITPLSLQREPAACAW